MEEILAVNIPSKLSNSWHNLPWMNRNLKRLIRKKGRRFKKAKKSGMDEDRARYLDIEQMVKRELRDTERVYVNGILQNGLESGNNKPFWKYVKSPKQETFGISALKSIFTQLLCTGELPTEWTQANFAPILKKGSELQAVNYCHVSLTCITCKLFEHILVHLEDHKILTDLQHGFRSGRSCETQLVTTFQDLAQMHNKKGSQIDIAVLDFSKAFDTVPHGGLLSKLKHYGIDEKIWLWIYNFLKKTGNKVS